MAWLLPLIVGSISQNMANKGAAQQNTNANAASVQNAGDAWNNAWRRMAPYLQPGAGPMGGMSVASVGTPSYGTPYGSPGAGAGAGAAAAPGAGGMDVQSIIKAILAQIQQGGIGGFQASAAGGPQATPPFQMARPTPGQTQTQPAAMSPISAMVARYMPQLSAAGGGGMRQRPALA